MLLDGASTGVREWGCGSCDMHHGSLALSMHSSAPVRMRYGGVRLGHRLVVYANDALPSPFLVIPQNSRTACEDQQTVLIEMTELVHSLYIGSSLVPVVVPDGSELRCRTVVQSP